MLLEESMHLTIKSLLNLNVCTTKSEKKSYYPLILIKHKYIEEYGSICSLRWRKLSMGWGEPINYGQYHQLALATPFLSEKTGKSTRTCSIISCSSHSTTPGNFLNLEDFSEGVTYESND